jgi:hypothetical protein
MNEQSLAFEIPASGVPVSSAGPRNPGRYIPPILPQSTETPPRASVVGKPVADKSPTTSSEEFSRMVAVAAYYRAQKRGFAPGGELDDWLAAEIEISRALGRA